ncbi:TPA: hypothetical protein N0F65_003382 [Lagenidium giganteum]|uniref:DUF7726 domain-containing protein n=1 Tax=Lagenidium giganteum TaxID=4803 RepID=A0AAV2YVD3_9STRA|nr:TPA: hypothetical protein N0F65_003382 [Lagenidium giganteum]
MSVVPVSNLSVEVAISAIKQALEGNVSLTTLAQQHGVSVAVARRVQQAVHAALVEGKTSVDLSQRAILPGEDSDDDDVDDCDGDGLAEEDSDRHFRYDGGTVAASAHNTRTSIRSANTLAASLSPTPAMSYAASTKLVPQRGRSCHDVRRKIIALLDAKWISADLLVQQTGCDGSDFNHFMNREGEFAGCCSFVYKAMKKYLVWHEANRSDRKARPPPFKKRRVEKAPASAQVRAQQEDAEQNPAPTPPPDQPVAKRALNCNQLRAKVRALYASKKIKRGALVRELKCDLYEYERFMESTGKFAGRSLGIFKLLREYFARQEKQASATASGKPPPQKRRATRTRRKVKLSKDEREELLRKIEAVEFDEKCPVYDDSDTVREKIEQFLESGVMTKTAWLKYLNINSNSMRQFFARKGPKDGATQEMYPVSYRFLERYRILNDEPKSPRRLRNEVEQGDDGFEYGKQVGNRAYTYFLEWNADYNRRLQGGDGDDTDSNGSNSGSDGP